MTPPPDEEAESIAEALSADATVRQIARLAVLAGARVDALENVGEDIRNLNRSVDALATAIGELATKEEVEATAAELDQKRRRGLLLTAVGVTVAFVLLAVPSVLSVVLLDNVRRSQEESVAARRLLVECTTPSPTAAEALDEEDLVHECFEQSQARTAQAIGSIHLAILDAATCAATARPPDQIAECYADRVEARTGTRP